MTSEVLAALVRMNLAAAAAILAVIAVRLPARRWLGPETAYRLWAIPPLAALATLLPPRVHPAPRMSWSTLVRSRR